MAGNDSGNWPTVRDSWVEEVPAHKLPQPPKPEDAAVKSIPPPLPEEPIAKLDPKRAELMFERLAANDYEAALLVAQGILTTTAHDQDALECAEMSARELWKLHTARLKSLDRVPHAVATPDALPPTLNLRAGFLLARVDGVATIQEIVNRAGLSQIDALRGIAELYLCGAIRLSD